MCQNQGVLDSNCYCNCPGGITGEFCEVTPCNPYDPCMNGGVCSFNIVNNQVEFECACPAGFTGVFCQNGEPACDKVCQNQGVLDSGACACTCPVGITGEYCEVTPCNPYNPCMNGSTCSFDIVNNAVEFECQCLPGWTGIFCQNEDEPECTKVCQNSGVLDDSDCSCTCPSGIDGEFCEVTPTSVPFNPCMNGGSCSHQIKNNAATFQ